MKNENFYLKTIDFENNDDDNNNISTYKTRASLSNICNYIHRLNFEKLFSIINHRRRI